MDSPRERDADQLFVVTDIDGSVGERWRAPDHFAAKGIVGGLDDLGPSQFLVAFGIHLRDHQFAIFIEQVEQVVAPNHERRSASLRPLADRLAGFPQAFAAGELNRHHFAALIASVHHIPDHHRLHVDGRHPFFGDIPPELFRCWSFGIQFDH
jgi:hypothetical protein